MAYAKVYQTFAGGGALCVEVGSEENYPDAYDDLVRQANNLWQLVAVEADDTDDTEL